MKYIIMLGDGMADDPLESLGGKTPLEAADKPHIDSLAPKSLLGMVSNVPEGMKPGSDVANLSVFGYDPKISYSGRSPLEAISMGIRMEESDVAIRCNTVTLSDAKCFEDKIMLDYSAGEISTEESEILIRDLADYLKDESFRLYPGISYRHCLIWKKGEKTLKLTPPHDISDQKIGAYLPRHPFLLELIKKSYDFLSSHPLNRKRMREGKNPANSIWFWGEGTKPEMERFDEKYGLKASVISAVDLIKGLGICAGMEVIEVEGATGTVHTNFKGKGEAAIDALLHKGMDYVYIHCEGPDECGHHGDEQCKILAIERIDHFIVGPLLEALKKAGEDYVLLVLPDHPTPVSTKTHSSDPVPFLLYRSGKAYFSGADSYSERSCKKSGIYLRDGHLLIRYLLDEEKELP
ncbi:MAG: cofactor-independent phosphoglycerate mutase [Johnsonella sp.]|nr:cofactor-independent phosphoglycerate mutase [Johnsonella sp.]